MTLASDRGAAHRRGRLPNFLIVGAPRSGTSSMNHYLRQHPDVFMAPGKELRFFTEHFDRGKDWYESCFADWAGQSVVGEATPRYMYDSVAVSRMAELLPGARLMVNLRNPIDRSFSAFLNATVRGREHRTFADVVEQELSLPSSEQKYLGDSRFLLYLRRLTESMPESEILVVILETMVAEPTATYQRVCTFLGVDTSFVPPDLGKTVNQYVEFRSLALRRISKRVNLRAVRRGLEALNTKHPEPPTIDPRIRGMLTEYFAEERIKLSDHLGIDLARWWT